MAEVVGGVLYGLKNVAESAALLAKGIYDPTLPLKARLQPLSSVNLPLTRHSISVVKGRAYLFGGTTVDADGTAELTPNDMHVLILPSSGIESLDYKKIEATNDAPPKRYGHSAAVVDESIYIFGGSGEDDRPLSENGRVWVYDTSSNKWSYIDPSHDGPKPEPRVFHASVATEHPRPVQRQPQEDILPQQPPDPEVNMPDIPDASTYGTLIIQGGQSASGSNLSDTWSFDFASRTWKELPELPGPAILSPSLVLVDHRLYAFAAGQTSYLDLDRSDDEHKSSRLPLTPLRPWQRLASPPSGPEVGSPGQRAGASMFPITTGQGRNYLGLVGGQSQSGDVLEDIWTLQLRPEDMSAASLKDAARTAINKETNEARWEQVKYHNEDGVMIQEGQPGRGVGARKGFAAAKAADIDGESVLIWGGMGADDKVRGDGLMITLEA